MIREVKIVTTGYAPEFGQTMGMIYNAITPSGTNTLKGQGSYRMQRSRLQRSHSSRRVRTLPIVGRRPTSTSSPSTSVDPSSATRRTFLADTNTPNVISGASVITITPANQARLGLNEPRICRAV